MSPPCNAWLKWGPAWCIDVILRVMSPPDMMVLMCFPVAGPHGEPAEREGVQAAELPGEQAAAGGERPAAAAAAPGDEEHAGEVHQEHDRRAPHTHTHTASNTLHSSFLCFSDFKKSFFLLLQSLADQEIRLKVQIKELEANVVAAAPDKAKQKQMEKNLEAFKKGTSPSWTGIRRLQETSRLGQGYILTALLCSSQTSTRPPAKPGRWRTR